MASSKGTNLIEMVKLMRREREKATALLPASLHHYLDERIAVSSWYPEEDMYGLMRTVEKMLPISGNDLYREIGILNAKNHLSGSYRHLLTDLQLKTLPIRAEALWKSLHDTGELRVEIEDESSGRAVLRSYENPGPEMCLVIESYLAEVLRMAKLVSVRSAPGSCVHRGDPECSWHFQAE